MMMYSNEVENDIAYFQEKVKAVQKKYSIPPRPAEIIVMRVSEWGADRIQRYYSFKTPHVVSNNIQYALRITGFAEQLFMACDVAKYLNAIDFSKNIKLS